MYRVPTHWGEQQLHSAGILSKEIKQASMLLTLAWWIRGAARHIALIGENTEIEKKHPIAPRARERMK
jgi:hypothetical protein